MRLIKSIFVLTGSLLLSACIQKGPNPVDPYESINRKIYKFNRAFDATMLKPPARLYKAVLPAPVRTGVSNFYNNLTLLPTVANDLLQTQWNWAIKDSWRFLINSTFGIGGLLDPAAKWGLPPHSNDLGITLAKWGDKNSPYIMIPFIGPSTIRDGMGLMFDYALFMPYPYMNDDVLIYSLIGLRYIDLRAQLLDTERLMDQALDKYSFLRDAYLQHRNYLITGVAAQEESLGSMYVDEDELGDYIDDEPSTPTPNTTTPSPKPKENATHRTVPA